MQGAYPDNQVCLHLLANINKYAYLVYPLKMIMKMKKRVAIEITYPWIKLINSPKADSL